VDSLLRLYGNLLGLYGSLLRFYDSLFRLYGILLRLYGSLVRFYGSLLNMLGKQVHVLSIIFLKNNRFVIIIQSLKIRSRLLIKIGYDYDTLHFTVIIKYR
jgi:hypothetical protein